MKKALHLILFLFVTNIQGIAQLKINELACTNTGQIADYLFNNPDWLEIVNATGSPVNLSGYTLTDDILNINKWVFPSYSLAANARVVIFASGLNIATPELHTNFKISDGETIFLFGPSANLIDSITLINMQPAHTRARIPDVTGSFCYTNIPTPNGSNIGTCYTGYASKPIINTASGFYSASQVVTITGSNIRYTLDGKVPTASSTLYTGSISINSSKVLRARSFQTGKLPSEIASSTFFINEATTLSVVSIIASPNDLFINGSGGIAVYDNYGNGDEVPCTLEYFNETHQHLFKENGSLKVVGNYSVAFAQKGMQFVFDEDYGAKEDPTNIFIDEKPSIPQMHGFRVRNFDDDACCARMRDPLVNKIASTTHAGYTASKNVCVFINGNYWGHYSARELLNEDYCHENFGTNKDRTNVIKKYYNQINMVDAGSDTSYLDLIDFLANNSMSSGGNYSDALDLIDYQNWVDYWAVQIFIANEDWYSSVYYNNTQLINAENPDVKWKFILWDCGYSQYNPYYDALEDALGSPNVTPNQFQDMFNSLLNNVGFKNYFINRFADLMNYHWTTSKINQIISTDSTKIHNEITPNYNRWTGQYQQPPDLSDWQFYIGSLKGFYTNRSDIQRDQINNYFALDGKVNITLNTLPAGAGRIKISTIIPDSYPWTGVYFDGVPVKIQAIANPGYTFSNWSANSFISNNSIDSFINNISANTTFIANFIPSLAPSIAISEINYNSATTLNSGNWVELYNYGTSAANIGGWQIKDDASVSFVIPTGTILPAGQYLVFVNNLTFFQNVYPGVTNFMGTLPFNLNNGGDAVRLYNALGVLVKQVYYDDQTPWPVQPDGFGNTLENVNPSLPQNNVNSWFSGCVGGSPGHAFVPCSTATLNLKTYLQGYYAGAGLMEPAIFNQGVNGANSYLCDTITVQLRKATAPFGIVTSKKTLLSTSGNSSTTFNAISGLHYVEVKHRNSISTWSASPINFGVVPVSYDFTNLANKAYGSNQKLMAANIFAIYSGDLNQDENLDLLDYGLQEIDITNFLSGYQISDINGDGSVDLLDEPILGTNVNDFIFAVHP